MIKGLILCEGNSDQILLGQLLQKRKNWKFVKKLNNAPFNNQNIAWYKNTAEDLFGIWYVGGSNFIPAVKSVFKRELLEHTVESLLVVTDNDDTSEVEDRLNVIISEISSTLKIGSEHLEQLFQTERKSGWQDISFYNSFANVTKREDSIEEPFEKSVVHFGYLLIPEECNGALETFMLKALCESSDSRHEVADKVHDFVARFNTESKYNVFLKRRRDKIKAELGMFVSVINPDKMFDTLKELIESVDWSKFDLTNSQFSMLLDDGYFD